MNRSLSCIWCLEHRLKFPVIPDQTGEIHDKCIRKTIYKVELTFGIGHPVACFSLIRSRVCTVAKYFHRLHPVKTVAGVCRVHVKKGWIIQLRKSLITVQQQQNQNSLFCLPERKQHREAPNKCNLQGHYSHYSCLSECCHGVGFVFSQSNQLSDCTGIIWTVSTRRWDVPHW